MLEVISPVYLIFLTFGVISVFAVLFYSFTRNSRYENQVLSKKLVKRRQQRSRFTEIQTKENRDVK
ncbi:hypothetical protein OMCYN_01852 [cyanobiont of Ornithocercus magnificus]|nr:hypothetical protein OMCYN_01852 [cyanobiont of Ornithocercus magnificus]